MAVKRIYAKTTPEKYTLQKAIASSIRYVKGVVADIGAGGSPYRDIIGKSARDYIRTDIKRTGNLDLLTDACTLAVKDEAIDTILCTQVLEHLPDPNKALSEFWRILKVRGFLLLTVPQYWEVHEAPNDYWRFTKFGIKMLLERSGFQIVDIFARGGCFMLLGQVIFNVMEKFGRGIIGLLFPIRIIIFYSCMFLDRVDVSKRDTLGYLCIAQKLSNFHHSVP